MKTVVSRTTDISFINVAKTLAIFFVPLGHLHIPSKLNLFICSFLIQTFFFISGYLFSIDTVSTKKFLTKKFKSLMIPFYFIGCISFLFHFFIGRKYGDDALYPYSLSDNLIGLFFGTPFKKYLGFNFPLWFLPTFFSAEIIFFFFQKYIKKISLWACLLCFFIGIFLKEINFYRLPFCLDISMFTLIFLQMGYFFRKKKGLEYIYKHANELVYRMFLIVVFFVLVIIISQINDAEGYVSTPDRRLNNYFLYVISGFVGSIFLLLLSDCIPKKRFFDFYGRNTILILGFHLMALSLIKGIQVFIFHIPLNTDRAVVINIIYVIFVFVILTPVIYLINTHTPFLIGRKKGIL